MRPSDFDIFTLKLTLFHDFYAKVLLILFDRRDLLNRKVYRAKSSNINILDMFTYISYLLRII